MVSERRELMKEVLKVIHVTGASHEAVVQAIENDTFKDFEDCLQDKCAETVGAEFIITNNVKDFSESAVKAITPAEFLEKYNR